VTSAPVPPVSGDGRTSAPRQTSLLEAVWLPVRDGNDTARAIFSEHYFRRHYRDGRRPVKFIGPGEYIVLVTPDALAVFAWRKFRSMDITQHGVNCAIFRNEGPTQSSDLIRAAVEIAWERWPGERLYTYVNPRKVRHKRDPGRCFLRAGWSHCGWSKGGLRILEIRPEDA
jgi:hypothetical protein